MTVLADPCRRSCCKASSWEPLGSGPAHLLSKGHQRVQIRVHSEVGRLTDVMVHTPGEELLAVTPTTRSRFLYTDLVDLAGARAEHQLFCAVLSRFCRVHQTTQLATEALQAPGARRFLLGRSEEITADRELAGPLAKLSDAELVAAFVQGDGGPTGPFSHLLGRRAYALPPLPNLFYARDAAMVVGDQVAVAAMQFPARWPEEVLARTMVGHHPIFTGAELLYDGADERRCGFTLEGGDVHPLRSNLLLIGISERTSAAMVDLICEALFARAETTDVVAVVLPEGGHAIHLDMVWTQIDRELCVVHPPTFMGPTRAPILHRRRGHKTARQADDLFSLLRELDMPMQPVMCGGQDPIAQEREQWASGCNHLAVAPGQVIAYGRNSHTVRAMAEAGLPSIGVRDFLAAPPPAPTARFVVLLDGGELVRGGGGPRCMTFPIHREELPAC